MHSRLRGNINSVVCIGIACQIVRMMPSVDVISVEMNETFFVQLVVIIGGDRVTLGSHLVVDMISDVQVFLARDMIFFRALTVKRKG